MQNVLTDLKAWMAPLQPEAHHNGTLCKVHAGFLSAWLHHGFSEKVLARLRELDSNKGQPLRFWVCGHSLGGALATLAALRIRQQHPMSQLTVITYGCPRVSLQQSADQCAAAKCRGVLPSAFGGAAQHRDRSVRPRIHLNNHHRVCRWATEPFPPCLTRPFQTAGRL
jgi:pimeloyl-ACP methyl ester carboxylesterase